MLPRWRRLGRSGQDRHRGHEEFRITRAVVIVSDRREQAVFRLELCIPSSGVIGISDTEHGGPATSRSPHGPSSPPPLCGAVRPGQGVYVGGRPADPSRGSSCVLLPGVAETGGQRRFFSCRRPVLPEREHTGQPANDRVGEKQAPADPDDHLGDIHRVTAEPVRTGVQQVLGNERQLVAALGHGLEVLSEGPDDARGPRQQPADADEPHHRVRPRGQSAIPPGHRHRGERVHHQRAGDPRRHRRRPRQSWSPAAQLRHSEHRDFTVSPA
jgi:hypothetical protein